MITASSAALRSIFAVLLWSVLLLAGCAPAAGLGATATAALPASTVPLPTPTQAPTSTPEPGRVLLIATPGSDAQAVQALLEELSAPAGLVLAVQPELQPGGVGQDTRVAVLLAAPPNLAELLASAPQARFVVYSPADLPPAGNLSVIRTRAENQAFLAGFISVLLSPDWRAAGLLPADGPLGAGLQDAYANGGRYYCGVCAPGWPLGMVYPQVAALPAGSDGPTWQAAAAGLYDNQKVEAYYLSAAAARPEVFAYLQGREQFGRPLLLVGDQAPPEALRGQWAATVAFDALEPLRGLWPGLLAGQGEAVVEAPLVLRDVNPANLGEGRLRLVEELIDEIAGGRIFPFTLPQQ
jgi:hypothetical protein